MDFDEVDVLYVEVTILQALSRCLLAHGVPTQAQEGLADRVWEISHHVLGHNFNCLILKKEIH